MKLENWHKEAWIKNLNDLYPNETEKRNGRTMFIEWCKINKPEISAEEAGLIYDSHVMPKEEFKAEVSALEPTIQEEAHHFQEEDQE